MDRRVLVIGESGFMLNAIINGLTKEDYETVYVEAAINRISRVESFPDLVVLYLDQDIVKDSELLIYLKDTLSERESEVFIIGNDEEIDDVSKVFPDNLMNNVMHRPLNVKDLAAALDKAVEKGNAAEELKKILIVDDDPTMLRMLKTLLSASYRVYVANSGMNAITFLATNKVDLILLDYEMPVISGAKVLEMIRSEMATASIPVMFLTAKNDRESVMQVLALKPEKYLLKTMTPAEWISNIDEYFAEHR